MKEYEKTLLSITCTVFIHVLDSSGKYLMTTSNNIKLHSKCTNLCENK